MILHLIKNTDPALVEKLAAFYEAVVIRKDNEVVLVTPFLRRSVEEEHKNYISRTVVCDTDIQLASKKYESEKREIKIGEVTIGGKSRNCLVAIGPCGVESEELIGQTAEFIK
jgi:3-deoxy-7-phosphoheptulonate synthase